MQQVAIDAVNDIVASLVEKIGANAQHIYQVVLAGNSTMQQIFLGIDPSALGELPFVQAFGDAQFVEAREIGLEIYPYANVVVFPQIGGFVGGDTVAAMATTRIDECDQPTLLIDIGTNGEIVLAHNGLLLAASTAAGPALEGAKIEHGMRAASGAIEKIAINGDELVLNVIGNVSPVGLCGTALIDVVAEMLRNGLLSQEGRILSQNEVGKNVPNSLRTRLFETERGNAFLIANTEESGLDKPICLYQQDVSEMQLAVGAIRAGINLLLKQRNLTPKDLNEVWICLFMKFDAPFLLGAIDSESFYITTAIDGYRQIKRNHQKQEKTQQPNHKRLSLGMTAIAAERSMLTYLSFAGTAFF